MKQHFANDSWLEITHQLNLFCVSFFFLNLSQLSKERKNCRCQDKKLPSKNTVLLRAVLLVPILVLTIPQKQRPSFLVTVNSRVARFFLIICRKALINIFQTFTQNNIVQAIFIKVDHIRHHIFFRNAKKCAFIPGFPRTDFPKGFLGN